MWAPYHVCLKFSFNLGISVKMKKEVFEETIVSGEQMLKKLYIEGSVLPIILDAPRLDYN